MEIVKFSDSQIYEVLDQFGFSADKVSFKPLGIGHINQSWLIEFQQNKYILQYINPYIFSSIEILTRNFRTISEYLKTTSFWETLRTPELIHTRENKHLLVTNEKYNWRVLNYIEHDANYKVVKTEKHAYEAAKAYGSYAKCLSYLPISNIGQTILNFHDPEARIIEFGEALNNDPLRRRKYALPEIDFIRNNSEYARKISKLIRSSVIPTRITHNNTAIDNLLWKDNRICAIVDLDTTMPSTLLYDFGDMVRTYTSPILDEAKNSSVITAKCNIVCAIIEGYLESTSVMMTPVERNALYEGALVVIYIQAVKYMTDFLLGDPYYPTSYPDHNLNRVRNHFELFRQVLSMESEIKKLIL